LQHQPILIKPIATTITLIFRFYYFEWFGCC